MRPIVWIKLMDNTRMVSMFCRIVFSGISSTTAYWCCTSLSVSLPAIFICFIQTIFLIHLCWWWMSEWSVVKRALWTHRHANNFLIRHVHCVLHRSNRFILSISEEKRKFHYIRINYTIFSNASIFAIFHESRTRFFAFAMHGDVIIKFVIYRNRINKRKNKMGAMNQKRK